jgi:hypothetical protein
MLLDERKHFSIFCRKHMDQSFFQAPASLGFGTKNSSFFQQGVCRGLEIYQRTTTAIKGTLTRQYHGEMQNRKCSVMHKKHRKCGFVIFLCQKLMPLKRLQTIISYVIVSGHACADITRIVPYLYGTIPYQYSPHSIPDVDPHLTKNTKCPSLSVCGNFRQPTQGAR